MKKILIMLLVIALVFTLTGCGVKENIEKKVGAKRLRKQLLKSGWAMRILKWILMEETTIKG